MDITVQKAIGSCRSLEKQLSLQLAATNVSYAQLEDTLHQICSVCSTALLQDLEAAAGHSAEERLWDSHQKVNQYYRSALAKLRNSKEPTSVARRKLEGSYLRFIKSSQRFYRGYIHDLSAAYGGIQELERIARNVGSDGHPKTKYPLSQPPRESVLLSCHMTLIHLGDLSRYRETELPGKERNWGPAVGFYDLAISVLPTSGLSYNQLAVIALADGSLFRATYQLYRSLSADEPHPQAEQNLRKAFFKVSTATKARELAADPTSTAGASLPGSMIAWYLRLISRYYHGVPFAEREELENEVINQMEVDLKKRPLENSPHRLVIINIAAGHAAQERLVKTESPTEDAMQSYLYFLRLNMRMFLVLTRIFRDEVVEISSGISSTDETSPKILANRLRPLMKRLLPALHLYSLWLCKNVTVLASPLDPTFATLQGDFWTTYASCLSALTQVFPAEHLKSSEHLLEEDEETVGFKPLHCDQNHEVWYAGRAMKPRWHDLTDSHRDTALEMLSRITSFVVGGLKQAMDSATPIVLESTGSFVYQLPNFPSQETASTNGLGILTEISVPEPAPTASQGIGIPAGEEVASLGDDIEAQRMVDSIVGLDDLLEESRKTFPTTPPTQSTWTRSHVASSSSFPVGTHTANDLLEAVQNYSQRQRMSAAPHHAVPAFPGLGIPSTASALLQSPSLSPNLLSDQIRTPQQLGSTSRPGTASRTSPLAPPPGLGHSRMNSNDSVSSTWIPDTTWTPYQPSGNSGSTASRPQRRSLYNDRALGNGTFGDLFRRESGHDSRVGSVMNSPSLSNANHDIWGKGTTMSRSHSHFESPLHGQFQNSQWSQVSGTVTPTGSIHHGYTTFSRPLT